MWVGAGTVVIPTKGDRLPSAAQSDPDLAGLDPPGPVSLGPRVVR